MKFNNKNVVLGTNVKIGKNVKIGDNTTIYDNVIIGDNSIICNDCIIGEPLNNYYSNPNYENPNTIVGSSVLIRSHSIIYAGTNLGNNLSTGHRVTIREYSSIGSNSMIGSYCDLHNNCRIGNYTRLHSNVIISEKSEIGNYVFLFPFSALANDPTPPSNNLIGAKIDDFTVISTGALILPGSEIGKYCLIAAKSLVNGNYPDNSFISGSPARRIGDLNKMPFFNKNNKKHYPWPYNFDRAMPWEGKSFEEWNKTMLT